MLVWPKNDELRKLLKHPNGVRFRPEGPADWPADVFTHRRIHDGDVSLKDPNETAKPAATTATRRRSERSEAPDMNPDKPENT